MEQQTQEIHIRIICLEALAVRLFIILTVDYSRLTGLWTICQTYKDTNKNNSFEIYADNNLVYSSPSLTGGDLPVEFEADINNCEKLRIVFTNGNGAGELEY